MKIFITGIIYLLSIVIMLVGAGVLANNTGLLPRATGNGLLESKLFGIGIFLFGLSVAYLQLKQTNSAKYLAFSTGMLAISMHSIPFSIRTYSTGNITNTDVVLLITFSILNIYLFYLSYKHREKDYEANKT